MPVNGLVTMTPTSIASTGTGNSSSINTNGSVTFSTCAALSLNGVFTSSYDNYMVTLRSSASLNPIIYMRFRASGTDNSTTASYVSQLLEGAANSVLGSRTTAQEGWFAYSSSTQRSGATGYFLGPNLAQATAWRSTSLYGVNNAVIHDMAGTHSEATSYDGFTLYPVTGSFTGLVTVYGFNQ